MASMGVRIHDDHAWPCMRNGRIPRPTNSQSHCVKLNFAKVLRSETAVSVLAGLSMRVMAKRLIFIFQVFYLGICRSLMYDVNRICNFIGFAGHSILEMAQTI